ncbi:uncharacterized protein J3D65DRAFT_599631 [Phyllosticta citribraziliensis]|uniref:BZIP domain-containing protein n=1 Tax=Phyllosticta citribraziliensis TaxID=989973 RepID=A0ABR1MAZ3_9PEZI
MASKKLDLAPALSPASSGDASAAHSPFTIPSPTSDGAASPITGHPSAFNGPSSVSTPIALAPGPGPASVNSPYISPAMNSGPCGNSYVIPPRPKPGRKPATDDPPSKRKQQNREAQRAFRQRKTQKMEEVNSELQRVLDERRGQSDQHQREVAGLNTALTAERSRSEALQSQVDTLTADKEGMRQQLDFVQEKLAKLERDLDYFRRLPPHNQLTPPAWRPEHEESTLAESRGETSAPSAPPPHQSTAITLPPLVRSKRAAPKDGCGKCADNGDCPCVDSLVDFSGSSRPSRNQAKELEIPAVQPHEDEMEIDFTNFGKKPPPPGVMEPPCKPGTCDACMKDPLQKRFCETLARERPFITNKSSLFASMRKDDDGQAAVKRQRLTTEQQESIDCAEAYKRFFRDANLPVDQEHPAWMRELITLPPTKNDAIRLHQLHQEAKEKRKMSAYELDMASVLNVLKKADTRHSVDASSEQSRTSISISSAGENSAVPLGEQSAALVPGEAASG